MQQMHLFFLLFLLLPLIIIINNSINVHYIQLLTKLLAPMKFKVFVKKISQVFSLEKNLFAHNNRIILENQKITRVNVVIPLKL